MIIVICVKIVENSGVGVARSALEPHIIFFLTLSLNLIFYLPHLHCRNLPISYLLLLEFILIFHFFFFPFLLFPLLLSIFSSFFWLITRTDRWPPKRIILSFWDRAKIEFFESLWEGKLVFKLLVWYAQIASWLCFWVNGRF